MFRGVGTSLRLEPGDRVAIVGGGPAGAFFALHLLRCASQIRLPLVVTVFEGKDFSQRGPPGCNRCAGLLSSRLVDALHSFGLAPPTETVMAHIAGYRLMVDGYQMALLPPTPTTQILSVYRGSGPLLGVLPPQVSFDAWLLQQAEQAGAHIVHSRVQAIDATGAELRVRVNGRWERCALVALATGVNSRLPELHGLPYHPPRTEVMAQDEVVWPLLWENSPGQSAEVHVHAGFPTGLLFAALVPKGPYVNVNLLGHPLPRDAMDGFLSHLQKVHGRSATSPAPQRLCGCRPRIAVSAAQGYFANRFVAVGDAAVTRLYKDGIGSAFVTAERAAATVITQGISQADFARSYQPLCQEIGRDNCAGHWLVRLWAATQRNRWLRQIWWRALKAEAILPSQQRPCHQALWGMFTGDSSYRQILRMLSSRAAWGTVVRSVAAELHGQPSYPDLPQEG